jgi:hypothetical protein
VNTKNKQPDQSAVAGQPSSPGFYPGDPDFFCDVKIPRIRGADDSTSRMPIFFNCFELFVFAAASSGSLI